jgi:hypothetical protein
MVARCVGGLRSEGHWKWDVNVDELIIVQDVLKMVWDWGAVGNAMLVQMK